jgi:hypothetical protein
MQVFYWVPAHRSWGAGVLAKPYLAIARGVEGALA